MTKRENALRILHFDHPERVMEGMPTHSLGYRGVNHEALDGTGGDASPVGTRWQDIWGIGWEKKQEGIMGYPIHHPLREINALRTYRWPDPDDPRIYEPIYRQAEGRLDADTFLCGSHRNLLLEKAEKLVGMEDLLLYFYTEPEFVRELLHRYMDFQLGIARHYLALGIEMISCSEDLGTQSSTLIGPALWREFLLPEYKRLLEPYKQRGIIIEFHSCGHIRPFVEPLMELGVDILNPVQATANDLNELRQVTQGRMALHGGVRSDLILNGPTEAIEREAWTRMWQLGREGGYFCDQDQHMNFPPSHRAAFRKAVDQHGWYPLIEPAFT